MRILGDRAASRLAAAGRRAIARGDVGAAANLLGRAAMLFAAGSRERIEVLLDLVEPLAVSGQADEAAQLAAQAIRAAELLGDELLLTRARIEEAWLVVYTQGERSDASTLRDAEKGIPAFERLGDDTGVARACEVVAMVHYYHGRLSEAAVASERGFLHAERARDAQQQGNHRLVRTVAAQWGFTPLDRVEAMLEDDLAWARETGKPRRRGEDDAAAGGGSRRARRSGRKGRHCSPAACPYCSDLGMTLWAAGFVGCWIWGLTDDPLIAEPRLRASYDMLADAGRRNVLSTVATIFAECVYRQERYDEADDLLDVAAEAGADDDFVTQVRLRAGRAKLLARRSDLGRAEAVARDAVALAAPDRVHRPARRFAARARRGAAARRPGGDGSEALRAALALWEAKGNVAHAARTCSLLAEVSTLSGA